MFEYCSRSTGLRAQNYSILQQVKKHTIELLLIVGAGPISGKNYYSTYGKVPGRKHRQKRDYMVAQKAIMSILNR